MGSELEDRLRTRGAPELACGDGWLPIIDRLDRRLAALDPDYVVAQVKAKLGGLRFYASTSEGLGLEDQRAFDAAVTDAEVEAQHTCEVCGHPARGRSKRGWQMALCPAHAEELGYR